VRIVPYDGDENLEDLRTLSILIKAVPFEDGYAPAFTLVAPTDDHFISISEANCLMDGIEIASRKIDELIAMMLQSKIAEHLLKDSDTVDVFDQDDWEDEDDDNGEVD
jgi:hypothetical protein